MRLGERVLDLLEKSGATIRHFSESIGSKPTTVIGWRQPNRNPSSELVVPICEFFEITPNELFDYDTKRSVLPGDIQLLVSRYETLDDDGKTVVQNAAIMEQRRIEGAKKEPPFPLSEEEKALLQRVNGAYKQRFSR